jgi:hypothetical protein
MLECNAEPYLRDFVSQNPNEIGVAFTLLAFRLSIAVLAFSAYLYVTAEMARALDKE